MELKPALFFPFPKVHFDFNTRIISRAHQNSCGRYYQHRSLSLLNTHLSLQWLPLLPRRFLHRFPILESDHQYPHKPQPALSNVPNSTHFARPPFQRTLKPFTPQLKAHDRRLQVSHPAHSRLHLQPGSLHLEDAVDRENLYK